MKNLRLSLPLVDGSVLPLEFASGRELIEEMAGGDWAAPPRCLLIEARAEDGTPVVISVPFSDSGEARVAVGEEAR